MNKLIFGVLIVSFLNCKNTTPSPEPVVITPDDPTVGCTDAIAKNFKTTATTEDCSCQYDFASKVSAKTPDLFLRKVLIEEHSGTWCGWCPIAKEVISKLTENKRVIGIEIHYNDELADTEKFYNPLKSRYGHPAFPSGMVNRRKSIVGTTFIMGFDDWDDNVDDFLKTDKIPTGLAIDTKLTGNTLEVLSHVNIKTAVEDNLGLGIYLVEDKVKGYPQLNYLAKNIQFSQYQAYKLPSLINDIEHPNVAREAITPILNGIEIPIAATKNAKVFRKLFKIELPKTIKSIENCKIIAFVVNQKSGEIVNVQDVGIGLSKDWD
jgi:thiol-disulfide isomerase/thioredoxin